MTETDRRQFLTRAATAGALIWATPTVLAIEPAAAATLGSNPPRPPSTDPPVEQPLAPPGPRVAHDSPDSLAFTGNSQARDTIIGIAFLGTGAAAVLANRDGEPDWEDK